MANTYCRLHFHLVFGTKNRMTLLELEIEDRVHRYIVGIVANLDGGVTEINGTEDHLHLLFYAPPKHSLSDVIGTIKANSSRFIHAEWPRLADFSWQRGYGLFTVSESNVAAVQAYIRNQKEHHKRQSFQDEYLELLRKHRIYFDEQYVFD